MIDEPKNKNYEGLEEGITYKENNGGEQQPSKVSNGQFTFKNGATDDGGAKDNTADNGEGSSDGNGSYADSIGDFGGFDFAMALSEVGAPWEDYTRTAKLHEEEIAQAEAELGTKQQQVYEVYGYMYELDLNKLVSASDDEIGELIDAINQTRKIQDEKSEKKKLDETLNKMEFDFTHESNLDYVWKGVPKDQLFIGDYPKYEKSIPAKIKYFQEKYEEADSNGDIWKKIAYSQKIGYLNSWKEKYDKYMDVKGKLDSIGSIEDDSDYMSIIKKYQNPNDIYSQDRKDKAVYCQDYSESSKEFGEEAEKQRLAMTPKEREALIQYTGDGSTSINHPLYGIDTKSGYGTQKGIVDNILQRTILMTDALDKCTSSRDIWLQRGISDMNFAGINISDMNNMDEEQLQSLIGREFTHNGFMSCGSHKGGGFHGGIILNIYCPKGTHMHYIDKVSNWSGSHEDETIINRGYHYVIRKIEKQGPYGYYVDVDLILGSDKSRMSNDDMKKMYKKHLKEDKW